MNGIIRFGIMWTLVQLFYCRAWRAGFVTDFTGLAERLDGQPFSDFIYCFGFPALEQITLGSLWVLYHLFSTEPFGWYLVFTTLHALSGFQLWRLTNALQQTDDRPGATWLPWLAALMFLLCPYQTEVVVWRVCFNFVSSSFLIISTLYAAVRYFQTDRPRYYWQMNGILLLAFFTFELALTLPFMVLTLLPFVVPSAHRWGRHLWGTVLPQFGLLVGYFLLNKWWLGVWIGHYGAEAHLKFTPELVFGNFFRHLTKLLLFVRNWPHAWKEAQNEHFVGTPQVFVYSAVVFLGVVLFIWFFKKISPRLRLAGLSLALFVWALAPVANLYYAYILNVENDRYGYLPAAFFAMGFAFLLARFGKKIAWMVGGIYLIFASCFLWKNVGYWQDNATVYNALLDNFPAHDAPVVYLLAFPDNYRGTPMFKNYGKGHRLFKDALRYVAHRPTEGKIYQIAQFNQESLQDSFYVSGNPVPGDSVHLEFAQWGNWWWRNAIGADTYRTDDYKWKRDDQRSYFIPYTPLDPNAVFLWSAGSEWRQLRTER